MTLKNEWKTVAWTVTGFLLVYFLPVGRTRFDAAVLEAFHLAKWYAREHVILCLVPAFFIAGAIGVFVSQASVMKYLGAGARKVLAYGVASVSGSVLAVCSCTVLPLFGGIYKMGAGLGPATAFLYSGPAINILAIILTARILGLELGIARAVGAIVFSIVIGLGMHLIFRKEEAEKAAAQAAMPEAEVTRPLWQTGLYFGTMVLILVFANWGAPNHYEYTLRDGSTLTGVVIHSSCSAEDPESSCRVLLAETGQEHTIIHKDVESRTAVPGLKTTIWDHKWHITGALAVLFAIILVAWFNIPWWKLLNAAALPTFLALALPMEGVMVLLPFSAAVIGFSIILNTQKGEPREWFSSTWIFAKQIIPLLVIGVLIAGFLLGQPHTEGIVPARYVQMLVGDSPAMFYTVTGLHESAAINAIWPLWTNLFAAVFGAFMYFATLTEVPILQGLLGAGMGKGPALALLLAGPALSLPNMLVIRSIMGTKKTVVFILLVIILSTVAGLIFGLCC